MGQRLNRLNRRGLGEIVDRLIDLQLLQRRLLGGKRLASRFVSAIGGQPDAVADGEHIIVDRNQIDGAFADAKKLSCL